MVVLEDVLNDLSVYFVFRTMILSLSMSFNIYFYFEIPILTFLFSPWDTFFSIAKTTWVVTWFTLLGYVV